MTKLFDAMGYAISPCDVLARVDGVPCFVSGESIRKLARATSGEIRPTPEHDDLGNAQKYLIIGDLSMNPLSLQRAAQDALGKASDCKYCGTYFNHCDCEG